MSINVAGTMLLQLERLLGRKRRLRRFVQTAKLLAELRPPGRGGGFADQQVEAGIDPVHLAAHGAGPADRLLNGIRRGDLFIMSHPEFRGGIVARNEALLRAIPDEPINEKRAALVRQFGTLIHNPIYDGQEKVPVEKY